MYGTGAFSEQGASHLAGGSASGTELQDAAIGTLITLSPLSWASGGLSAESSAAEGGMSGLKTYGSLIEKFGAGYESVAVTQGKYLPIELGQKLNTMSPGSWSKIYEAGLLNSSKVETHYFFNATTGQYVNPFIKSSGWGRIFRDVTGF